MGYAYACILQRGTSSEISNPVEAKTFLTFLAIPALNGEVFSYKKYNLIISLSKKPFFVFILMLYEKL